MFSYFSNGEAQLLQSHIVFNACSEGSELLLYN